jgi:hypothetical protein
MPRATKIFSCIVSISATEREALGITDSWRSQGVALMQTTSRSAFGRAVGLTRGETRDHAGETGNAADIALAKSHAGKVVIRPLDRFTAREGAFIVREPKDGS